MNDQTCPKCRRVMLITDIQSYRINNQQYQRTRYICGCCGYQNRIETDGSGAARLLWDWKPVTWQTIGGTA